MATSYWGSWKRFGITVLPMQRAEAQEVKRLNWLKQLFCGHDVSSELRSDKSRTYKKRHYRYCKKCDKRYYVD